MAEDSRLEQEREGLAELPAAPPTEHCLNCGTLLTGLYCSSCGQKKRPSQIGFRDFVHDLIHEFLHLDGKFARTMGLLLKRPGQLTIEFLDGRRARYISPLRLYLVWSAVFFTLALSFPDTVVLKQTSTSSLRSSVKSSEKAPASTPAPRAPEAQTEKQSNKQRNVKAISEMFLHNAAKGMFLLMPFFGLLLFVFYRRRVPFYLPHLYFSIHYHSFVFLGMSLMVLLKAPKIAALDQLSSIVNLSIMIYLYLSLRRVYGASKLGTIWRMVVVGLLYIMGLVTMIAAILIYVVLRN